MMTLDMCPCLFQSADSVLLLWVLLLQHLNECETASHHNNAPESETRSVCMCVGGCAFMWVFGTALEHCFESCSRFSENGFIKSHLRITRSDVKTRQNETSSEATRSSPSVAVSNLSSCFWIINPAGVTSVRGHCLEHNFSWDFCVLTPEKWKRNRHVAWTYNTFLV